MNDPMDSPPTKDYGADRFDYVEVEAPFGLEPAGDWWGRAVAEPCPDCRANLFAKWGWTNLPRSESRAWHLVVAHDDGCPVLAREGRPKVAGTE